MRNRTEQPRRVWTDGVRKNNRKAEALADAAGLLFDLHDAAGAARCLEADLLYLRQSCEVTAIALEEIRKLSR